jgi:zinc D-Ala-D-Ala carboxypeptidase
MNITEHFSMKELTNSQTAIKNGIPNIPKDPQVVANLTLLCEKVLEPLREGMKCPIRISSGYRSPELNKLIGGAKASQHNIGEAVDIDLDEKNAELFSYIVNNLDFDQIIWEFGDNKNPNWVHVSYKAAGNRKQLLKALKLNGKTSYQVMDASKFKAKKKATK